MSAELEVYFFRGEKRVGFDKQRLEIGSSVRVSTIKEDGVNPGVYQIDVGVNETIIKQAFALNSKRYDSYMRVVTLEAGQSHTLDLKILGKPYFVEITHRR